VSAPAATSQGSSARATTPVRRLNRIWAAAARLALGVAPMEAINAVTVVPILAPITTAAAPWAVSSPPWAAVSAMVREALETGKATTDAMWSSGKKYFARMFLVSIMMGLAVVIGIVFLLPGIALLPSPLQPEPQAVGLLAIGAILFILYALIISLVLAVAPYALVVDSVGAVKAILASIDFFKYNKFDIFVLWLVVVALSLGMQMIGSLWVGENAGFQPLSVIVGLVNVLVLAPLSAVWWTRLYMVRKGMLKGDEVLDPW